MTACPTCRRRFLAGLAGLAALPLLASCRKDGTAASQPPVPIGPDDVCAVCGMTIAKQPGPKAEAYLEDQPGVLKFGGTVDFFSFILQPENRDRLQAAYVQDMAQADWNHPVDHWIDARKAWYVPTKELHGEMGPTLASFASRADAEAFAKRYGGEVLTFAQATPKVIFNLGMCQHPDGDG